MLAPIVLFVYNRLEHTRKTVAALQKNALAPQSELIVFSDGPKKAKDEHAVALLRTYLKTIGGFKKVRLVEQEKNIGLSQSIVGGVTQVVNTHGRVIVLEDDLIVSPHFLQYMNEALEKYQNEPSVMQISGYMFNAELKTTSDGIFLPFVTGWGWGTWQRAWQQYDATYNGYDVLKKSLSLVKKFNLEDNYNYFGMLESCRTGKVDSWGIRWYLSVFLKHGIALHPTHSLVINNGFDGSGTNYVSSSKVDQSVDFKTHSGHFVFPDSLSISPEKNKVYAAMRRTQKFGFLQIIVQKIKLLF